MEPLQPPTTWAEPIRLFLTNLRLSGAPRPTITLRSYHLRRFAIDCGTEPWTVTATHLLDHLERHDWSPSTVKTFRSTMREFYRWAILHDHTDRNPADKLPRIRVAAGTPRPASEASLQEAYERADARTRLMIRLAAEAGLRCREIALVHHDDLTQDLLGWTLTVHGKGDKTRQVPISDDLAADLLPSTGYVFEGLIDGHLSAHYISKCISRALPGATAHQLRHRFATRAYQLGGRDIRAVQELLGHASVATTQVYTAVEHEALRRAALSAA